MEGGGGGVSCGGLIVVINGSYINNKNLRSRARLIQDLRTRSGIFRLQRVTPASQRNTLTCRAILRLPGQLPSCWHRAELQDLSVTTFPCSQGWTGAGRRQLSVPSSNQEEAPCVLGKQRPSGATVAGGGDSPRAHRSPLEDDPAERGTGRGRDRLELWGGGWEVGPGLQNPSAGSQMTGRLADPLPASAVGEDRREEGRGSRRPQ